MTKIRYIKDSNDQNLFPVTPERAVRDSNGVTLDEKLAEMSDPNAVKYTEQELTDAQKEQARENIGACSAEEAPGSAQPSGDTSVKYTVQNLTSAQKAQARTNIGAGCTNIGAYAFQYVGSAASKCTFIVRATTPPTLGNPNAFYPAAGINKIYVPNGCLSAYQAAPNWNNSNLMPYYAELNPDGTIPT